MGFAKFNDMTDSFTVKWCVVECCYLDKKNQFCKQQLKESKLFNLKYLNYFNIIIAVNL